METAVLAAFFSAGEMRVEEFLDGEQGDVGSLDLFAEKNSCKEYRNGA